MSILGQLQRRIGMQGEAAQWAKNGKIVQNVCENY